MCVLKYLLFISVKKIKSRITDLIIMFFETFKGKDNLSIKIKQNRISVLFLAYNEIYYLFLKNLKNLEKFSQLK